MIFLVPVQTRATSARWFSTRYRLQPSHQAVLILYTRVLAEVDAASAFGGIIDLTVCLSRHNSEYVAHIASTP